MSTSPTAPAAVEATDAAANGQPTAPRTQARPRRAPRKRPPKVAKAAQPVTVVKAATAPKVPSAGKAATAPKVPTAGKTSTAGKVPTPGKAPKRASSAAPVASGKQVATAKPAPVAKSSAADKPRKAKAKLVRDSFTMPQADFDLIAMLKQRALVFQRPAKKSELLRAGLHALLALGDIELRVALDQLTPLKVGRPKKAE